MIIETASGRVEGVTTGPVTAFRGVPYARPPVGPARFRPPVPAVPWTGVRQAATYGPAVPQRRDELLEEMFGLAAFQVDEASCLTLNVWTAGAGGAPRPVLVWLHGGGFMTGSGSDPVFDGARLAVRHDLVVVTLNYRIGVLGFLYLGEILGNGYAESGNLGLLDQLAALRWVRDNIGAFGGDAANVTLAGQSAGGMSAVALMTAPAAKGLFHKAIAQSASAELVFEPGQATHVARRLIETLGIGSDVAQRLHGVPVSALLNAQHAVQQAMLNSGSGFGLPFAPVVDGAVLAKTPLSAIQNGASADIPLILGTNQDEERLFLIHPGGPAPDDDETLALIGDVTFRAPADRLAEAQADATRNVWRYLFRWPSTARGGLLGACHSLELPFVFDNLGQPGVWKFTGAEPPQALADAMAGCWACFARHGRPGAGWPAYDTANRSTMVFDTPPEVVSSP